MTVRRRILALAVVALLACSACARSSKRSSEREPHAGDWKTWVLSSSSQVKVPPPPAPNSDRAKRDAAELADMARRRTPEIEKQVHYWGDYPGMEPWTRLNLELVTHGGKNPPRTARGYALMTVAIYDALVSAWHWKYVYKREAPKVASRVVPPGPDPSYPSEHAVIAGAASRVLAYLFPERSDASYDALADEAADSRVWAGTNTRSDVDAGLALGRDVADVVIAHARTDGSENHADVLPPPGGPEVWKPPPGTKDEASQPVEPLAGNWRTWVPGLTAKVRPAPPPAYGTPKFVDEAREVRDIGKNLTPDQKRIATFWAAGPGTSAPPGMWNDFAVEEVRRAPLSFPRMARVFALLNIAEADAAIAAWDCKYKYWSPRPVNAIRDLGLDPAFKSFLPTPIFPSYVSGHSTFSAAAADILAHFFPARAAHLRSMAEEAGMSRIYGGIHYRSDNLVGLDMGRKVARMVLQTSGVGDSR